MSNGVSKGSTRLRDFVVFDMQVDIFRLEGWVTELGMKHHLPYTIAPLQQPDYTKLRNESHFVSHDLFEDLDLRNCNDPTQNSRMRDQGDSQKMIIPGRAGIYLHWILPQIYRRGTAATSTAKSNERNNARAAAGFTDTHAYNYDRPTYRAAPTRWLVTRKIWRPDVLEWTTKNPTKTPERPPFEITGWIVESDRIFGLEDVDATFDIETEAAPFMDQSIPLSEEGTIFMGKKYNFENWEEDTNARRHCPLTILDSSNPFFADYQPLNTNVFSIKDDLSYKSSDGEIKREADNCRLEYSVTGWHTDQSPDPLLSNSSQNPKNTPAQTLKNCYAELKNSENLDTWLATPAILRSICHGRRETWLYPEGNLDSSEVTSVPPEDPANLSPSGWSSDWRQYPGLQTAQRISSQAPISVGTSTFDALFALLDAQPAKDVPQNIPFRLQTLLHGHEDFDAQVEAAEDLLENLFSKTSGGTEWNLANDSAMTSDAPTNAKPKDHLDEIIELNSNQALSDTLSRQLSFLKRGLFAEWWKYITANQTERANNLDVMKARVSDILTQIDLIEPAKVTGGLNSIKKNIEDLKSKLKVEPAAAPFFYQRKDPTIVIAGASPGWPENFSSKTKARLLGQIGALVDKSPGFSCVLDSLLRLESEEEWASRLKSERQRWEGSRKFEITALGYQLQILESRDTILDQKIKNVDRMKYGSYLHDLVFEQFDVRGKISSIKSQIKNLQDKIDGPPDINQFDIPAPDSLPQIAIDECDNVASKLCYAANIYQNFTKDYSAFMTKVRHKLPYNIGDATYILMFEDIINCNSSGFKKETYRRKTVFTEVFEKSYSWQQHMTQKSPNNLKILNWCPLFVEWEAKHVQIPFTPEQWSLGEHGPEGTYRYYLKTDVRPLNDKVEWRTLNGRSLVLPTPSVSMKSAVTNIFERMPPTTLEKLLPLEKQAELKESIDKLEFLAVSLEGLTNQLLTMNQGMHVIPSKERTENSGSSQEDDLASAIGIGSEHLDWIETESDLTPYANILKVPLADSPFVPVTHGQLHITKLHIVDKFGQIVYAVDPSNQLEANRRPLYPCASESLSVQALPAPDQNKPNAVLPESLSGSCQSIQLSPSINQPARLNAHYMEWPNLDVVLTKLENPVHGWIVINYANYSLQFFERDGAYVAEVRVTEGLPNSTTHINWRPFVLDPSSMIDGLLKEFLKQCEQSNFVHAIWNSCNAALDTLPHAPNAYAEFMSSALGRPLAIVVSGWSIELATPPLTNQSTLNRKPGPSVLDYEFPIRIGDKQALHDGLVGYFQIPVSDATETGIEQAKRVKWDELWTCFENAKDPAKLITEETLPRLRPYHSEKMTHLEARDSHTRHLKKFVCIVDPFIPLTGFTAILPTGKLRLNPAMIEPGLRTILPFIKVGPLLLPHDVPEYDSLPTRSIITNSNVNVARILSNEGSKNGGLQIPAVAMGDWNWLQPYYQSGQTRFNTHGLELIDRQVNLEEGKVYTAVEGYLQLRKPMQGKE